MGDTFSTDPVIEAYKPGVDITLIRENLKRTPDERVRALVKLGDFKDELQRAMKAKQDEKPRER